MAATDRGLALLALLALGVVSLIVPLGARAQTRHRVAVGTTYYTDSDGLSVVHPSASGSFALTDETRLDVGYDADVVSAATVDVRTSASLRPFEELRQGGNVSVSEEITRTASVAGRYAVSHSPDFESHTLGLRAGLEDDARIHRVGLDLGGSYSLVGRAGDPRPFGDLWAIGATVSWTGVLARWLVADAAFAIEGQRGVLESPYRFVAVRGDGQAVAYVPESVPDERVRAAAHVRLRAALTESLFARASYRLHADDWGIVGHTVELRGTGEPLRGLSITLGGRLLVQRGASFYRGTYRGLLEVPVLRTRDRELAPGFSARGACTVSWRFVELEGLRLAAVLRGELTYYRTFDTPLLPEKTAVATGLSLIGEM